MNHELPATRAMEDAPCINVIRTLSMDAIQQADSGHPGAPLGLAAAAYALWTRVLRHNPRNPRWPNRDRFVLSGGHASMLLYSLLHLTGYDLSLDDIKQFRQLGSRTPGHPEYGVTPGVETTTGPLGQGFSTAVGMAMAERHLAARFNQVGHEIVDHFTYVMCGDGDLMEGISYEAASLAGHLGLGKLICIYDDNKITIEGSTDISFTEDVGLRFKALNWQVLTVLDGNDVGAVLAALEAAKAETGMPSIIVLRTHIAYGSPNKQGTPDAHGAPLGVEEVRLTKRNLGCDEDLCFCVPDDPLAAYRQCIETGAAEEAEWQKTLAAYREKYPGLARDWEEAGARTLSEGWDENIPDFKPSDGPMATRAASGKVLNAIAEKTPVLMGGSADLAPSNNTLIKSSHDFQKFAFTGRNIRFGVREHAMGAILSGLALHGGIRPYGGTFLVFADYMRPAIRLAALMEQPVIYIFTHDSIAVGEDGPTHQPIEHVLTLRAIPGLTVIRPADAAETAVAWRIAMESTSNPTALILTRQNLPILDRSRFAPAEELARGAYIISECEGTPDIILIATGSEVHITLEARERLEAKGISARVVAMPSWELFERNDSEYKEKVLPSEIGARLAVEAGSPIGWERYAGRREAVIGIDRFGASARGDVLLEKFGFTPDHIVQRAMDLLKA